MNRKRLNPDQRKTQLLDCAVSVATKLGVAKVTHAAIAKEHKVIYKTNCSVPTVFNYFKTADELESALVNEILNVRNETVPTLTLLDAALISFRNSGGLNNSTSRTEEVKKITSDFLTLTCNVKKVNT